MFEGANGPPAAPLELKSPLGVTVRIPGAGATRSVIRRLVLPRPEVPLVKASTLVYLPGASDSAFVLRNTVIFVVANPGSVPLEAEMPDQPSELVSDQSRAPPPVFVSV